MTTVTLSNGTTEAESLVRATMLSLYNLLASNPVALIELVAVARDSKHNPWGDSATDLQHLSLMQPNKQLHESIRNIVLSAATGEGLDMGLQWPVAAEVQSTIG